MRVCVIANWCKSLIIFLFLPAKIKSTWLYELGPYILKYKLTTSDGVGPSVFVADENTWPLMQAKVFPPMLVEITNIHSTALIPNQITAVCLNGSTRTVWDPGYPGQTMSVSWLRLLMTWFLASLGHQQLLHWQVKIKIWWSFLSYSKTSDILVSKNEIKCHPCVFPQISQLFTQLD